MKLSLDIGEVSSAHLKLYAGVCAWALAPAHARAGDAATISGYLGKSDDQALDEFALAHADQPERDHGALKEAVKARRAEALVEGNL